ncbi:unnamed protein product, partial [Polarella glacialis]
IPVVFMERQSKIFPIIFDIDLKCASEEIKRRVPEELKRRRPWRSEVAFSRWDGADWLVLGHGDNPVLLRHLGKVLLEFYPERSHVDLCVFNASGWDRVKKIVKVSLHLVVPDIVVTPERLTAIRERMMEYFDECSSCSGHPLELLLQEYLRESGDNTWDGVVDASVTRGNSGLRMPYCDKAQEVLKHRFRDDPAVKELPRKQQLEMRAFTKEESGRPCLPVGLLRLSRAGLGAEESPENVIAVDLPDAVWKYREEDCSMQDWMRWGRCRYNGPEGPTPWSPPLRFQWAEPPPVRVAPAKASAQQPLPSGELPAMRTGHPLIRRFRGDATEFRERFSAALSQQRKLRGRWLVSSNSGLRWKGGLRAGDGHEMRFVAQAPGAPAAVLLLLAPETVPHCEQGHQLLRRSRASQLPALWSCALCGTLGGRSLERKSCGGKRHSQQLKMSRLSCLLCGYYTCEKCYDCQAQLPSGGGAAFAAFRCALAGWTEDSDILSPIDAGPEVMVAPSQDFPCIQAAIDAAPPDVPLQRIIVPEGVHELPETLRLHRRILLEGRGRWRSQLVMRGQPVLRYEGEG